MKVKVSDYLGTTYISTTKSGKPITPCSYYATTVNSLIDTMVLLAFDAFGKKGYSFVGDWTNETLEENAQDIFELVTSVVYDKMMMYSNVIQTYVKGNKIGFDIENKTTIDTETSTVGRGATETSPINNASITEGSTFTLDTPDGKTLASNNTEGESTQIVTSVDAFATAYRLIEKYPSLYYIAKKCCSSVIEEYTVVY